MAPSESISESRRGGALSRSDVAFYRDLLQNHSRIMTLRIEAAARRREPGLLLIAHMASGCASEGAKEVHELIFFYYILKETSQEGNSDLEKSIRRLVEVYHELIHPGPGHAPTEPHRAIMLLLKSNHEAIPADRDALRLLLKAFSPFPPGSRVCLQDGRWARVVEAHQDFPQRPTVEILDSPVNHEIEDLRRTPYAQIKMPLSPPPMGRTNLRQDEASLEEERCPSCQGGPVRFSRFLPRHWLRKARGSSKRCCLECGHHWNEPKLYAPGALTLPPQVAAALGSFLALLLAMGIYLSLLAWAKTTAPRQDQNTRGPAIRLILQSP